MFIQQLYVKWIYTVVNNVSMWKKSLWRSVASTTCHLSSNNWFHRQLKNTISCSITGFNLVPILCSIQFLFYKLPSQLILLQRLHTRYAALVCYYEVFYPLIPSEYTHSNLFSPINVTSFTKLLGSIYCYCSLSFIQYLHHKKIYFELLSLWLQTTRAQNNSILKYF